MIKGLHSAHLENMDTRYTTLKASIASENRARLGHLMTLTSYKINPQVKITKFGNFWFSGLSSNVRQRMSPLVLFHAEISKIGKIEIVISC